MAYGNFLHIFILLALQNSICTLPEAGQPTQVLSKDLIKPSDSHAFTLVVPYFSDAVLPCYSPELDETPIFRYWWYKNGQEIGRVDRKPSPVIQTGDGALWVQNATTEDSGVYSCRVYTDLGTKEVNVTLIVLDAEKAPFFSEALPISETTIRKKVGSSVELRCPADGVPMPKLEWYHNQEIIAKFNVSDSHVKIDQWSVVLKNLTIRDSGNYSCIAMNRLGSVSVNFSLSVTDGTQPDLAVFHPLNTTVKYASSATFQCRVRSDVVPNIQWLKRVEDNSFRKQDHDVLKVQGENYRLLRSSQVVKRPDGSYLNKLVIAEARESDSGKYICLGANKMGYSFRSAFLTVLPRPRSVTGWSHHISLHPGDSGNMQVAFPTVGGGLGIALAIVVVGAFYFICRRRSRSHLQTTIDPDSSRQRLNMVQLMPSTSIEMDHLSKNHTSLSKTPLISTTSPAQSEVELAGSGMTVTKLYENPDNCENCYKLRDEV